MRATCRRRAGLRLRPDRTMRRRRVIAGSSAKVDLVAIHGDEKAEGKGDREPAPGLGGCCLETEPENHERAHHRGRRGVGHRGLEHRVPQERRSEPQPGHADRGEQGREGPAADPVGEADPDEGPEEARHTDRVHVRPGIAVGRDLGAQDAGHAHEDVGGHEERAPEQGRPRLCVGVGALAQLPRLFGPVLELLRHEVAELVGEVEVPVDHGRADLDEEQGTVDAEPGLRPVLHPGRDQESGRRARGRARPAGEPAPGAQRGLAPWARGGSSRPGRRAGRTRAGALPGRSGARTPPEPGVGVPAKTRPRNTRAARRPRASSSRVAVAALFSDSAMPWRDGAAFLAPPRLSNPRERAKLHPR